jgi:hypothetical protein
MATISKEYKLRTILKELYKYQKDITLCYRPTEKNSWADRVKYLSPEFNSYKEYNHRTIINQEIVIEYDDEDPVSNKHNVDIIAKRLSDDGLTWSKWSSGNKSVHLHCLIDIKDVGNVSLLKNAFIRVYSKGLPLPDMRLVGSHLIRAEYGVHEKTGKRKTLISRVHEWEKLNTIKKEVWDKYQTMMKAVSQRRLSTDLRGLENSEQVKLILNTVRFRQINDGRERALFMLIHLLKEKYADDKDGLTNYLWDWYKYCSGYKLTKEQVRGKVNYHWGRDYYIGMHYINTFLEELGVKVEGMENGERDEYQP